MSTQTKTVSPTVQQGLGRRGPGMGAPVEKAKNAGATFRRLLRYFRAELPLVAVLALVVTVAVVCSVAAPGRQSLAVDRIVTGQFEGLVPLLCVMLALYLAQGGATLVQGYVSASLSQRVVRRMRSDLFRKIVSLPVSYLDGHSHGDVMSRMTNDAENISNVISQSLSSLFSGVLTLLGTLAVMLWYSVKLTLLCCITIVLTVVFTRVITGYMRKYYVQRQKLLGQVNGTVEEMVTNTRTVTAYNRQDEASADFDRTSDALTKTGIIAEIIGNAMGPVMNTFNNLSFIIVAVFGARFVLEGSLSVGVISAFIIYSKQFARPVNELSQLYGQIQTAIAGAERIFDILDQAGEPEGGAELPQPVRGAIEFRHVDFSYVPGTRVISDFNLRIEPGRKIALVGSTGSGKTTVINLLMRFYELDGGCITLDGVDIRDLSLRSLRDAIGIVLQDTVLFSDTVRANLTYADPGASQEALDAAARASNCDSVVDSLPQGYDTYLASAGANLSQGQRQLLAIGRAFLSYPYVLILDEATSSVDTRTEQRIQDAMQKLMENRTSLIIAHRISTIQDADQIIVMDQGSIVETGTHEELLARKGDYYRLYMTQFAGQQT